MAIPPPRTSPAFLESLGNIAGDDSWRIRHEYGRGSYLLAAQHRSPRMDAGGAAQSVAVCHVRDRTGIPAHLFGDSANPLPRTLAFALPGLDTCQGPALPARPIGQAEKSRPLR